MALYLVVPAGDIDLVVGANGLRNLNLLSGPAFVRQKIASRLKFFLGEWFLDLLEGIPYYRIVLIQNPDLELIRTLFTRVIMSVQEVGSLTNLILNYDPVARTIGVSFDADLINGGVLLVRQPDPAFVVSLTQPVAA